VAALLLVFSIYHAPFRRYDELKAECVANFSAPVSFGAYLWMFPLEVRLETYHKEARLMGLSSSEDPTIVAWVILIQCRGVTDERTDMQMD